MAIPSFHSSTGLSIVAEDPLLKATRGWSERLTDQIQTYSHEIRAIGGYWSSTININDRQDRIEDWIQNGLGRNIRVVDEALSQVFGGFVNKITVKDGPLEFVLGPLMDIENQLAFAYSTLDTTTNPPVSGYRERTAYANDTSSQALYGILQKVYSIGGSTATLAAQDRDTRIAEKAWPATDRKATLLGGSPGDLTLEVLGYWHWLTAYVYNQTALTGQIGVSTKMQAVLAAQPNTGLFSTDYSRITSNLTVLVPQYENDDRTAEAVMEGLNSVGDASYNRMNCGFYNNRQFVYEPVANEIRFVQRITSNGAQTDLIGGPVQPWRVMPNGYLFFADFLAGRLPPVTAAGLKSDPRCGRVEVVQYSAPYGLSVNGNPVSTLDQMLARQGLMGQGA